MNTIKAIRERLGLSQLALGRGIGCTQGNVFHYERGQTLMPDAAKRLITFCAEHGLILTMDQLYGLQPLPEPTAPAPAPAPAPAQEPGHA